MAATMVAGMVPAMAFAAEKDVAAVLVELKKEDVTKTNAKDYASAKAALAAAKAVQGTDDDAKTIVAAYEASINVLESADVAAWNANKTAYDAAVVAVKAANAKVDFSGSFESKNTKDNHQKKFDELQGFIAIDGAYKAELSMNTVRVDLGAPTLPTKVTLNGTDLDPIDFDMDGGNGAPNTLLIMLEKTVTFADIQTLTFELGGKIYKVNVTK